jgi:hypothetical protein
VARPEPTAATSSGGTAVPPGNCPTHGYHGRTYCPRCSTSAIPPPPLGQAPSAASGLWSGADPRIVTLRRERDEARRVTTVIEGLLKRLYELDADDHPAEEAARAYLAQQHDLKIVCWECGRRRDPAHPGAHLCEECDHNSVAQANGSLDADGAER